MFLHHNSYRSRKLAYLKYRVCKAGVQHDKRDEVAICDYRYLYVKNNELFANSALSNNLLNSAVLERQNTENLQEQIHAMK